MASTILHVDDDEASRYMIAATLRRSGFEVWEASTGESALYLARKQPDLVLLDVNLPDITGFEVCQKLRNDPHTSAIPILHISASRVDADAAVQGLEGGADGYLVHPIEPAVLVATINALLRAKKAELQWQTTFDSIGDGICLLGMNNEILKCNKAFQDMIQTDEDLAGVDAYGLLQKRSKDFLIETLTKDFHIGERYYRMSLHDVKNNLGEVNGYVLTISDITERQRAQEAIEILDERFRAILDNTPALVYIVDKSNKFLLVNKIFESRFGKTANELIGTSVTDLFPEDIIKENNAKVMERLTALEFEESAPHPDGIRTYISIKVPLFDKQGHPYAICGISTDITERKQAEETVRASLQEKEMLLHEIHHRVKNNLQVVMSLLGLQSQQITDSEALQILNESRARIKAMALIHENLYTAHGSAGVNLTSYLKLLANQIMDGYSLTKNIELMYLGDQVIVDINKAVPIGLILNELLSNSLKYAYDDVSRGTLEVSLLNRNDKVEMLLRDNGRGLPSEVMLQKSKTLGWKLINLLVRQIDGTLEILSDRPGANIRVIF